jgi:hypothetical protein
MGLAEGQLLTARIDWRSPLREHRSFRFPSVLKNDDVPLMLFASGGREGRRQPTTVSRPPTTNSAS